MNYSISYFPAHSFRPVEHIFTASTDAEATTRATEYVAKHKPFTRQLILTRIHDNKIITHFEQKIKLRITVDSTVAESTKAFLQDEDVNGAINDALRNVKALSLIIE